MIEELAAEIHAELCGDDSGRNCPRFNSDSPHRDYYLACARAIYARLEPEIGSANVVLAVSVILDETA